ncbi:MAG TPA: DUF1194 domain-containing protein [Xanthobacteraceae bacterium]|nr:DUF1194 domain-containing protein [Xanthobacteraceae bacterium]
MKRFCRCVLVLTALLASGISAARAAEQVDLLLALAMDVSRSMEQPKFLLQREGYAAAITNPQVLEAIKSGAHQKIAICFIDWSGGGEQKLVIDWSIIDSAESARHFGDIIYEAPRSFNDRTSIGGGITFAAAQIERTPYQAERRTIDVSGDGTNNAGRDVQLARDQAVAKGIVINGIPILTELQYSRIPEHTNPPGGLEKYYRDNVIGGPGSFVLVAEDYSSFGKSMVRKLIAEIAGVPPTPRFAQGVVPKQR